MQTPQNIAIVGIACRFPNADTPEQFWQNLITGKETAELIPADRWPIPDLYTEGPPTAGKTVSKWGCFINKVWDFDPEFFKLDKEEALFIDPQHRILLELAYEAIADGGYTAESFSGQRAGVFIGIAQEDYKNDTVAHLFSEQASPPSILANNLRSLAAGRIADSLNLKGPTMAIDTACSSVLTAMHYARLSLENGDCDYAFVGGVNLNLGATPFLAFSNAGALAPSQRCFLFDERNHGLLLGEGAGMILLTKEENIAGNELARLKGSAVNNDGRSHGVMTPNTEGQQRVMHSAYETSKTDPADLGYIEAHGTGTLLGDIVEARTLNRFFSHLAEDRPKTRYVGSVKPNVGHLLSGSGITSLIKVILSLHHKQIPPGINSEHPHRRLRFAEVGLVVNDQPLDWTAEAGKPRLAGINAFAFGGTNAHVILQEADQPGRSPLPPPVFNRIHLRLQSPQKPNHLKQSPTPALSQASWLHQVVWTPSPLPPVKATVTELPFRVIATDREEGHHVATQLTNQGLSCAFATPDQVTQKGEPYRLILLVNQPDQFDTAALIAQKIAQAPSGQIRSLVVVTSSESSQETLTADSNQLASYFLALGAELDIPLQFIDFNQTAVASPLFAELIRPPSRDLVLWRNGRRFVRRLTPLTHDPHLASETPLSAEGVYLITGGGSGVGAAIAKGLALDVKPVLILVGRKSLSDALERADFLGKLRWAGATADYLTVDMTDSAQVAELITTILQKYGRLDGIIHTAGVVAGERLTHSTAESRQTILAPKVDGVKNLHVALEDAAIQPTFLINFSSISAVLPQFAGGLSSYAAANGYLDGFAHEYRYQSLNWTVWLESGQAATDGVVEKRMLENLARLGLQGVTDDAGYALFKRALSLSLPQIVVINPEAINLNQTAGQKPELERNDAQQLPTKQTDSVLPPSEEGRIIPILTALLAEELDITAAAVPRDNSFANLGIDSMGAMELVAKLEEQGFTSLPATLFFEHNTVNKLANYLNGRQQTAVAAPPSILESAPAKQTQQSIDTLSPMQRAFLSEQYHQPDSVAYSYLRLTVQGAFDLEWGNHALAQLVRNHPQLRTRFSFGRNGAGATQTTVPADQPPQIESIDLSLSESPSLAAFEDRLVNQPMKVIGNNTDHLVRVLWVTEGNGAQHLIFLLHHIIADGWSLSNIGQEFWLAYRGETVLPPATSIHDYIAVLQEEKSSVAYQQSLNWWAARIAKRGINESPRDRNSTTRKGKKHKVFRSKLDQVETSHLKESAKAHGVTLFHWLLAAQFKTLTHEPEEAADIPAEQQTLSYSIGVAEARRDYNLPQLNRVVGSMADLFPLSLTLDREEPLAPLAERVRDEWLDISRHTHIPSNKLHQLLATADSQNKQPLYSAAFSFAHFPRFVEEDDDDHTSIQLVDLLGRTGTSKTRVSLICWTWNDALYFAWNYREDLYSAVEIETLNRRFMAILRGGQKKTVSFLDRIADHFTHAAHRVAVQRPETSYQALSNQLHHSLALLHANDFQAGDVVAFVGEPSLAALTALLATFWGGGTWLPLDPAAPADRLATYIRIAKAKFLFDPAGLLADTDLPQTLKRLDIDPIEGSAPPITDAQRPIPVNHPANIAYIIFTSGSTGEQKGVPITYANLNHYLTWAVDSLSYQPDDVQMWGTSLSFDATLRQCLAPLISGGSLLPIGRDTLLNLPQLEELLTQYKVTKWSSVPTLWQQMLAFLERSKEKTPPLPHLRQIQLGGEALPMSLVDRWLALTQKTGECEFVNLYGPTENTINTTYFTLKLTDRHQVNTATMPIGRPLTGVSLKRINEAGEPCPSEERGELLIGGQLLAPHYLNIGIGTNRLGKVDASTRYFSSGDLIEQLPDGNLLFIGRLDNQIKLRGYRVELEEIEQALLSHPYISQAAVLLHNHDEGQSLEAYVASAASQITADTVRQHLSQKLPRYMIPHKITHLNAIPQLANGKIDRQALLKSPREEQKQGVSPASKSIATITTATGRDQPLLNDDQLSELWEKVLKIDHIEPDSDFFALGGDSLNMIELMILLKEEGIEVERTADLFAHHTVASQAAFLRNNNQDVAIKQRPTPPPEEQHPFPLSPAQAGFWLDRQLNPKASATWYAYFWLNGKLDHPRFHEAVQIWWPAIPCYAPSAWPTKSPLTNR